MDFHRLFRIQPGDRVLDLGSGNGRHTTEACLWDCEVVSVDILKEDLLRTRYMCAAMAREGHPGRAHFVLADAQNLPFRDGAFDRVMCTEVFEHVPDDLGAMGEFWRVVKPGGRAAVSVPNWLPERVSWGLSWDYWHSPGGHIRIYTKQKLKERLERAGFRMGDVRYRHSMQSVYWFFRALFGLDNAGFPVTRAWFKFMNWQLQARNPIVDRLEAAADRVIAKDMILYGERPAEPAREPEAAGVARAS